MALNPDDPTKAQIWVRGEAPNQILDVYVPRGARGEVGPVGPEGPAVPTNLSVVDTVTGPETPGATGPQGIQGLKGDPGGWVVSTGIAAGTSLNDIITPGLYLNPQANVANGPSNSTNGGHLEVIAVAGYIYQRYTPIAEHRETYVRYRSSNNTWSAWAVYNSTRVDQTAGRAIYQWDDVNNREQLVYGDTGLRDISAECRTYGMQAGSVYLRRFNNMVTVVLVGVQLPADNISAQIYVLPTGFVTNEAGFLVARENAVAGSMHAFGVGSNILYRAALGSTTANNTTHRFGGQITVQTTNLWPTTLPGTAIGSIPNT